MIGVLSLQGAFVEHEKKLADLGVTYKEVRQKSDLKDFHGLIIPGGESTVMGKLLSEQNMLIPLRGMIKEGLPVFGTCAGLILLAKEVEGGSPHLATMDICTIRNAYGRQLGSFTCMEEFNGKLYPMTFIRAPYIKYVGQNVRVLAEHNGKIVAARQDSQLVTAFHPELTDNLEVHRYFLRDMAKIDC